MKPWEPKSYDAWYTTSLGSLADRFEKELVFSLVESKTGETALDVGCGTGNYSLELAKRGLKVIGCDSSNEMLTWAREKARRTGLEIKFEQADARALPFADGSFDLVISIGLLCFIKEPEKALSEMCRVLMPGGRLIVGVLNKWSPWAFFRRIKGLFKDTIYNKARFISPPELAKMVKQAGLHVKEVRTCLFLFPVNSRLYLTLAEPFERLDRTVLSKTGAFLAVYGIKSP